MKKQLGDQCYDTSFLSCFQPCLQQDHFQKKQLLASEFITRNHKSVRLVLFSDCIIMRELGLGKDNTQRKMYSFNTRSCFQMVSSISTTMEYEGLVFYGDETGKKKDVFYCQSLGVCQKWGCILSGLMNQRGFKQNYQFLQLIGKGHSSKVYKVKKTKTGEIFAAKVYQRMGDIRSQQAFLSQISILRNMSHPNIIKLYGSFFESGFLYAIIEYCSEGSLYNQITTKANLTKEEQTKIIIELTNAVEELRIRKIVHRDIKLQNIFIRKELTGQRYVLGDFGLAASVDQKVHIFQTCGTVGYTAPEVLRHSGAKPITLSHKMDTFSLGVIFHIILLKRTVFQYTPGNITELASLNKKCFINWKQDFYSKLTKNELQLLQCTLTQNPQNRFTTKQIIALPFFKSYQKSFKAQSLSQSESKTILSTQSPSIGTNSTVLSKKSSKSIITNSLRNLFTSKYKRTQTMKVQSTAKPISKTWKIMNWFKSDDNKSQHSTKHSLDLELQSGFVEEKRWKEKLQEEI